MSVTQKLVTTSFNIETANSFVNTFSNSIDNYYLFAGRHIPYPDSDSSITTPNNSVYSSITDVYDNMIYAKKLTSADVIQMIPKYTWTQGEVYDEYSDIDGALYDKQFFVMVDDDSEYNVYKCLFNNSRAETTTAPSRAGTSVDLEPIITADGYVWKYMYTITKTQYEKFATKTYIPVTANTEVIDAATPGTIEVIKVTSAGAGYDNYIANAAFRVGDISVGGVTTSYGAPESASAINDFYKGCVMKITSGSGVNQYRRIISYDGASSIKTFTLNSPFLVTPSENDTYDVYPYIYVWGDGNESSVAEGRAIIETSANGIESIEMLEVGEGYRSGVVSPGTMPSVIPVTDSSALIELPAVVSSGSNFEEAIILPVISPPYGHGGNPWKELGAKRVCVSSKFTETENDLFSTDNDYRQIGIIRNPKYDNVVINLLSNTVVGSYSVGEEIYQYKQIKLYGTVSMNADTNVINKENYGKISTTVQILNGGTGYDSTANNEMVFDNTGTGGSGAIATFANNGSGTVTSITVTAQGSLYESVPSVTVNPTASAGGSDGQFLVALANPEITLFDDALESNDSILIDDGTNRFLTKVSSANAYSITTTTNTSVTFANSNISELLLFAHGKIQSITSSSITLTDVEGIFEDAGKVIGLSSGASGQIATSNSTFNAITINDRDAESFNSAVQLYRLVGNYTVGGSPFVSDELIKQTTLLSLFQGTGYVHHMEINPGTDDDILYITNKSGVFNLDPDGDKLISGNDSGAVLGNLSNKYSSDLIKDSGDILYFENVDSITRDENKSEIIKIIIEF